MIKKRDGDKHCVLPKVEIFSILDDQKKHQAHRDQCGIDAQHIVTMLFKIRSTPTANN